ncbi:MAG: ATP-binding cassette domain-containing protein [Labilithrix sp.]|nr:ATP-binding cassette domain-containing protein [Labilithrix sp.]MCW5814010.1 ATP-binding cassette domain-containing protein [Labilithrix sp.]
MAASLLAEARAVAKTFGQVRAVVDASASFRGGEIHAVCGENGAGKSTLLKLVAGMIVPDAGEVLIGGSPLEPHTPKGAIDRGVAMVLQHFALVPVFTALENIMLGAEPVRSGGVLDVAAARTKAAAIVKELGVDIPLDTPIEELGIGDRQRIEIARALYRDAKLVILDEPTAVLTKSEVAALYATLRRLADGGTGIVVVTHKMDEVRAYADVVTVMRKGAVVFTRPIERGGDVDDITRAIMGGAGVKERTDDEARERKVGDTVCALEDVTVARGLRGASLELRAGEIVGVAGVEGNGQKELVAVLAGDVVPDSGRVTGGPFAIVREDRQSEGLVLDATLRDNIVLGELERFSSWGFLRGAALEAEAADRLARSGAPNDLDRTARTLSGGNQQKIVVTRALARSAKAVIASQPTRGVDLAAASEIHARFRDAASAGAGVLVISADLDELRALSDRILVLVRGSFAAEVPPTTTDDELGRLMLGGAGEDARA